MNKQQALDLFGQPTSTSNEINNATALHFQITAPCYGAVITDEHCAEYIFYFDINDNVVGLIGEVSLGEEEQK